MTAANANTLDHINKYEPPNTDWDVFTLNPNATAANLSDGIEKRLGQLSAMLETLIAAEPPEFYEMTYSQQCNYIWTMQTMVQEAHLLTRRLWDVHRAAQRREGLRHG